MADFVPKEILDNVNVSKDDPIKVLFKALLGLCVFCICIFIVLVTLSEIIIRFLPNQVNYSLGKVFKQAYQTPPDLEKARSDIQLKINALVKTSDLKDLDFHIDIITADFANALALPGGSILITTELLKELRSENELIMILSHELGHYKNNDHLRGLSRGIILMGLFGLINSSTANQATTIIGTSINIFDLRYSRQQENAADEYGIHLLNQYYGHVTGAKQVLNHLFKEGEEYSTLNGFLSTHPITRQRIKHMDSLIQTQKYNVLNPDQLTPYAFTVPESTNEITSSANEKSQ